MKLSPLGSAACSLALLAGALAPAELGTDGVRQFEHAWGRAPEPALHRLLRDLVDEAHERAVRDGAESTRR